jgi:mono/diheme cytochrome c family protein
VAATAKGRLAAALTAMTVLSACVGRPPADASGAEIYEQLCARCHGADLEGGIGPPLGAGSEVAAKPDSYLVLTITRGQGRMPSFEQTLSPEQVERLVRFIREEEGG